MHGWQILRQLWRIQRTLGQRSEAALSPHGLSVRLTLMLWSVERHAHATEMARALGLPAPTVSRLLKRLEGDGLVQRQGEAEDLRRFRFALTQAGRQALERGRQAMEGEMERLLRDRLEASEVEMLLQMLGRLAGAATEDEAAHTRRDDDERGAR